MYHAGPNKRPPCTQNGKTEYKSINTSYDATAEEFMDIYLDDDGRPSWDTMITQHEVLEHGDFAQRQQVVRWIRKFPFSFLTDREYVIARRMYRQGDDLYGISKVGSCCCSCCYSFWRETAATMVCGSIIL